MVDHPLDELHVGIRVSGLLESLHLLLGENPVRLPGGGELDDARRVFVGVRRASAAKVQQAIDKAEQLVAIGEDASAADQLNNAAQRLNNTTQAALKQALLDLADTLG